MVPFFPFLFLFLTPVRLLIVSAGRLTEMAALPPHGRSRTPAPMREVRETSKEKQESTAPMPLPEKSQIFISLFSPGFFYPSTPEVTAKPTTVFLWTSDGA